MSSSSISTTTTTATPAIPLTTITTTNDSTPSRVVNNSEVQSTHRTSIPTVTGTTPKTIDVDNHTTYLDPANNTDTTTAMATATNTEHSTTTESTTTDVMSPEGAPMAPTSAVSINKNSTGSNLSTMDAGANTTSTATIVSSDAVTTTATTDDVKTIDDSSGTSIHGGNNIHISMVEIFHDYISSKLS